MATPSQPLRQKMETTLRTFLNGYVDASTHNDPSLLSAMLTPSCKRKLLPASFLSALGAPTDLALDAKTYEEHWAAQMPHVKSVSVDVTHLSIDTDNMTGAARTVYVNRFVETGEEVVLELAWFVKFEEGDKLVETAQFADGIEFVKYEARVREVIGKGKQE